MTLTFDRPLGWRDIAAIANGARAELGQQAISRMEAARSRVDHLVENRIRAYGVNTGVGALCDTIVEPAQQRDLSRNIVLSHAVGTGPGLGHAQVRAIMAAAINNWAHGYSGIRPVVAETMLALMERNALPETPSGGSVGYLVQMAHIGLVLIGEGWVQFDGERISGEQALQMLGLSPVILQAKEGLSLVNGTPCATGLGALALSGAERLLDWADRIAALTFEALGGDASCFDEDRMALHQSPGLRHVAQRLREALAGSEALASPGAGRTQEALSLRAIPHVHGAARDAMAYVARIVDHELASPTDNPLLLGAADAPRGVSTAHAVASGVGLAMDLLGIAVAQCAAMAERRLDRLVNPLVSSLPAFLAPHGGSQSGFMIAQYTASSLVAENRRLAAPASLDGGITSALQEDFLCHATPASLKTLAIIANAERILGTEWLAAVQAGELRGQRLAPVNQSIAAMLRNLCPAYADDRPLGEDMQKAATLLRTGEPPGP